MNSWLVVDVDSVLLHFYTLLNVNGQPTYFALMKKFFKCIFSEANTNNINHIVLIIDYSPYTKLNELKQYIPKSSMDRLNFRPFYKAKANISRMFSGSKLRVAKYNNYMSLDTARFILSALPEFSRVVVLSDSVEWESLQDIIPITYKTFFSTEQESAMTVDLSNNPYQYICTQLNCTVYQYNVLHNLYYGCKYFNNPFKAKENDISFLSFCRKIYQKDDTLPRFDEYYGLYNQLNIYNYDNKDIEKYAHDVISFDRFDDNKALGYLNLINTKFCADYKKLEKVVLNGFIC